MIGNRGRIALDPQAEVDTISDLVTGIDGWEIAAALDTGKMIGLILVGLLIVSTLLRILSRRR